MVSIVMTVGGQEIPSWRLAKKLEGRPKRQPDKIAGVSVLNAIFFADDSDGCAAGDDGTFVCTIDGGGSWVTKPVDISVNIQGGFFCNNRKGWAVGDAKGAGLILLTEDAGRNWRPQYKVAGFELSGLHSVWFADEQHGWTVGEAQLNGITQGIILATEDGGLHWVAQYLGVGRSSVLSAIEFVDTQRGWAVGHNVILHTDDGGQKWRETKYVEGSYFFDLDVIDSEVWVVGSDGILLQTTDFGVSWHPHQLPSKYENLWLASVRFVAPTRGWVVGNDGAVFSTSDRGRTWKLESIGSSEYLRALASTSRSVFAVGNSGIILRRSL